MQPIVLYDLTRNNPAHKAWAPNPWKTRFALNYKKLPHTTVWLEFTEVESTAIQIGAAPTGKKPDGSPFYTTPMIHDPNTKKVLSDSLEIAHYLDETYPDIRIFPQGESSVQRAKELEGFLWTEAVRPMLRLAIVEFFNGLNPASQPYFRKTREAMLGGVRLEDVAPPGPERDAKWLEGEEGFRKLVEVMEKSGMSEEGQNVRPLEHADFVLGAYLIVLERVFGEESDNWRRIESWQGGRWKRFMDRLRPYTQET